MEMQVPLLLVAMVASWQALPSLVEAQTGTDVNTLLTELFTTKAYNNKIRPMVNQTRVLDIYVEFYLSAIIEFDEQNENVKTSGYLYLYWNDGYLTWDASAHNNITEIFIPQDDIWKPDVSLRNTFKTFKGLGSTYLNVRVYHTGGIEWRPFQVLESTCAVDITYFPFDSQTCEMKFTAWSYTKDDVNLNVGARGIMLEDYSPNNQWNLVSTSTREVNSAEAAVFFSVKLKRKPSFYVINIIVPVILLTVLNCFTFVLPVSSGERASYGITVFLSLAVFLTIVASELPNNSENTSMLSVYLMLMSGLSTSIVIMCLLEQRIAVRTVQEDPISRQYRWIVKMSNLIRCKGCRKSRIANENGDDDYVKKKHGKLQLNDEDGQNNMSWMDVVNSMDFFFFWICIIYTVVCTGVLFGISINAVQ